MARILMVHPGPDFSVADVSQGWERALKKMGHIVMPYNTNDRLTFYGRALVEDFSEPPCEHGRLLVRKAMPEGSMIAQMALKGLYEACYVFWPDIVWFTSAFFTTAPMLQTLRLRNHKIVIMHTESPYQDDEQMLRGQFADLNLVNDPTNLPAWHDLDVPAYYIPHSYDPRVHYPAEHAFERRPGDYESDFVFIGTAFPSRQKFFHEMGLRSLGIDISFGGQWNNIDPEYAYLLDYLGHHAEQCVENAETARVYRGAKAGINFYRREGEDSFKGQGFAMGPREIEMAADGLFFLRDHRGESDEVFGGILPAFESPQDAAEKLRWWLDHDSMRENRAQKARFEIQDWTFDNRAKQVCGLMEEHGLL